jgi:hypothetical protein
MTHLISRLSLAAMLTLPIATCAWGGVDINPLFSTVPRHARVVGSQAGVPDRAAGRFTIIIRDVANNARSGVKVVLDFSDVPDVVLCSDQADVDLVTNCNAHCVCKLTDAQGQVTFTLLGSSTGMRDVPSQGPAMYANGLSFGPIAVSTFDLDGAGGVGANDLSIWLADFGSGEPHARSDYDGSGTVGAGDLSEWLGVFAAGTSTQSCTTSCP